MCVSERERERGRGREWECAQYCDYNESINLLTGSAKATNVESVCMQGTGRRNREQGRGSREEGAGNREKIARIRDQGTWNRE